METALSPHSAIYLHQSIFVTIGCNNIAIVNINKRAKLVKTKCFLRATSDENIKWNIFYLHLLLTNRSYSCECLENIFGKKKMLSTLCHKSGSDFLV